LTKQVSLEELLEIYKRKFEPYGYEDRENQIDYYKAGANLLQNYYQKYSSSKDKHVVIEKMFRFDYEGIPVSGKIDRIDRLEDGSFEIIDYKTGETKTEKEVKQDDQLTLYALASKYYFKYDPVKLTYFYVEGDKKITTTRTEEDFQRLTSEMKDIFEKIKERKFEPKPSSLNCNYCDYKDICPHAIKD